MIGRCQPVTTQPRTNIDLKSSGRLSLSCLKRTGADAEAQGSPRGSILCTVRRSAHLPTKARMAPLAVHGAETLALHSLLIGVSLLVLGQAVNPQSHSD